MARASMDWQQWVRSARGAVASLSWPPTRGRSLPGWGLSPRGRWRVAAIAGGLVLWSWDWKLVLAASAGGSLAWLVVRVPGPTWQQWDDRLRQLLAASFAQPNGRLALALAGGTAASLMAYFAVALAWNAPDGWLAAASLAQGAGTLLALLLLGRQWLVQPQQAADAEARDRLDDLTADDPLVQLLAARHLARLARQGCLDGDRRATAVQSFRLLLARPLDPALRSALLEALAAVEPSLRQPRRQRPDRDRQAAGRSAPKAPPKALSAAKTDAVALPRQRVARPLPKRLL